MKVIMVHPAYDDVTYTLSRWAEKAIAYLPISDNLSGEFAVETRLRLSLANNENTELISFYGHGKPDFLIGNSKETSSLKPVISTTEPGVVPSELTGRKLYAVACHAGAVLGPSLATAGCAFVGYNMQFSYTRGLEEDFEKVVNKGLIDWATKNKTCTEILDQLRSEWGALRTDLSIGSRKTVKNAFMAALSAHWNHGCVCCWDMR